MHNEKSELCAVRSTISQLLHVPEETIDTIRYLKKGMTNHSYRFCLGTEGYILRVPGEGSGKLVNRADEARVYEELKGRQLSDEVIYISGETGYKIAKYWPESRTCNPQKKTDIVESMEKLRHFHEMNLQVSHSRDLFTEIQLYEDLRKGKASVFSDYAETKALIYRLEPLIQALPKKHVLTHIDAIPSNILFVEGDVRFIDWEYAAMHDPHLDLAMFALSARYNRAQTDFLIDTYFKEKCDSHTRMKIYAYMGISGLLWSNWSEFKLMHGVDYDDYMRTQYAYAKKYSALAYAYFSTHLAV